MPFMQILQSLKIVLVVLAAGISGCLAAEGDLFFADFEEPAYGIGALESQENWSASPHVEVIESPLVESHSGKQLVSIPRQPSDTEAVFARNNFLPFNEPLREPFMAEVSMAIEPVTDYQIASFVVHDSSAGETGAWVGLRGFDKEGYWLAAMNGNSWDNDWVKLDANPELEGVQPAEAGVMYRFQVKIDPEQKTFAVAVFSEDGKPLDHREGLKIRYPERLASGGYNRVSLYAGGGSHGDIAYYDDVRVWSDPDAEANSSSAIPNNK